MISPTVLNILHRTQDIPTSLTTPSTVLNTHYHTGQASPRLGSNRRCCIQAIQIGSYKSRAQNQNNKDQIKEKHQMFKITNCSIQRLKMRIKTIQNLVWYLQNDQNKNHTRSLKFLTILTSKLHLFSMD